MADIQICSCQIKALIAAMGSLLNEKAAPPLRVNLTREWGGLTHWAAPSDWGAQSCTSGCRWEPSCQLKVR